jgi:Fur family ferric uptake transcriptional regulator
MRSSEHHDTVLNLLKEAKGPLSADEVREHIGHRKISQATVYRILKGGVDSGLFREVAFPNGPSRFEGAEKPHHHHFICLECDRAFDMEGCTKGIMNLVPAGFEIEAHDILLKGRCQECCSS